MQAVHHKPAWFPNWTNSPVLLVGSGPSANVLRNLDLSRYQRDAGLRIVTVNNAFKLVPDADVLYSHAIGWWRHYEGDVHTCWRGKAIIGTDPEICKLFPDTQLLRPRIDLKVDPALPEHLRYVHTLLMDEPGVVGWGKNGGFHMLNWLLQLDVPEIILMGIDATLEHGVHWHGPHEGIKNPGVPDVVLWKHYWDHAAEDIRAMRLRTRVVNAGELSKLTAYPRVDLLRHLESKL